MVLVLPILMLALRIFGTPQHVTRRPSSVSFWAADLSCGAGAISSPVLLEHPKNVSECAMLWERTISEVSKGAPNWLLLSAVGIATRELASRQVQEGLVPALVTSGEARPKAKALSQRLRRNLDDRVQRVLQPAGYGNAERMIGRFVDAEVQALQSQITSLNDVIDHEITQGVIEVVEAEVAGRIQETLETVAESAGVNQTAAERDLSEIMRRADADGNEEITFDELYELMLGKPIDPLVQPLAAEWTILKSPRTASSQWERWNSLILAPPLKRLSQISSIGRKLYDRAAFQLTSQVEEASRNVTERVWVIDRMLELGLADLSPITEELPRQPPSPPPPPPGLRTAGGRALQVAERKQLRAERKQLLEERRQKRLRSGTWRKPWRWFRRERAPS